MAEKLRPLRTKSTSSATFGFTVPAGRGQRRAGKVTVTAEVAPSFDRLIRNKGRFTSAQRGVNEVHGAMAFETVMRAKQNLDAKVKENPRPNRTGRVGLRETFAQRFEQLYTIQFANRSDAGFTVDFNRLDEVGPRDAQGRPYWRYVEYGFGARTVKAMFAGPDGLSPPRGSRRFMDPRMPSTRNGAVFEISAFPGYGFIDQTIDERQKEIRRDAFRKYLWEVDWPEEMRAAAQGGFA